MSKTGTEVLRERLEAACTYAVKENEITYAEMCGTLWLTLFDFAMEAREESDAEEET